MRAHLRFSLVVGLGLGSLVGPACRGPASTEQPAAPAPAPDPDGATEPQTLADEIALLDHVATRARGLALVEQRIEQATDDDREAIARAITPALVQLWDEESIYRSAVLELSVSLLHPALAPVWSRAIRLEGEVATRRQMTLALEAITRTHAVDAVPALIDTLHQLMSQPQVDQDEPAGMLRVAMVEALGRLGDRRATPVLLKVLEQPVDQQPIGVHRSAVDALGLLADPAAVDALLTVVYTVPDIPTTRSISERAKIALAAIGEPAVSPIIEQLEGRHEPINQLADKHGLPPTYVQMAAATLLGTLGSKSAVEPLVRIVSGTPCTRAGAEPTDPQAELRDQLRIYASNALGLIGDARAVEPLCRCATKSQSPADMYPIAEALGRIGGAEATQCLAGVVTRGVYDRDTVASPEFQHEIRWEAARFGLMAAGPEHRAMIEAAMDRRQPQLVRRQLEQWKDGRALLARCSDPDCWIKVLDDPNAPWFPRELAAVNLARGAAGDAAIAEKIAAAYRTRNPDARVTMAWLAGHMMQGRRCPRCAERLADMLEQERDIRLPKEYQLAVLTARQTIGKLRAPTSP